MAAHRGYTKNNIIMAVRFSSYNVVNSTNKKELTDFCRWCIDCCYVRYTTVYTMLEAFSAITGVKGVVKLNGDYKTVVTLDSKQLDSDEFKEMYDKYKPLKNGTVREILLEPYYKEQEKLIEAQERLRIEMIENYG